MRDDEIHHPDEHPPFDEPLHRERGAFIEEANGEHVGLTEGEGGTTQDDVAEDAYVGDERPGTRDDVPYSLGTDNPPAADEHFVREGGTSQAGPPAPDEEVEQDLGRRDERELWSRQRQLIEEDEDDGIKIPAGMSDEEAERVMDALGDEAMDPLPEWPDGVSATGVPSEPEHGGFPAREEDK